MTPEALPSGSTIGILGGGQLGRMLAQAAAKLGFRVCVLAPEADSPAFDVSADHICAAYDDPQALNLLAERADAVTFEFENVSAAALALLEGATRVAPPRCALEITQDRLSEKGFLDALSLPTARWAAVENPASLAAAMGVFLPDPAAFPLFLKFARQGYDGKGQMRIGRAADLPRAQEWLGDNAAVLECGVQFEMELSVIAVRGVSGEIAFYDVPRNVHREGVLRESIVPAPVPGSMRRQAEAYARRIAEALGYVGVIAVEMFLERTADGDRLLVNEIAPRVHNSGHWTIEACAVSQFENHIRAVAGWPLGSTARHSDARMVNFLGSDVDEAIPLMRDDPSLSVHLYGKHEARPGRKMGHYVQLSPRQER